MSDEPMPIPEDPVVVHGGHFAVSKEGMDRWAATEQENVRLRAENAELRDGHLATLHAGVRERIRDLESTIVAIHVACENADDEEASFADLVRTVSDIQELCDEILGREAHS